LQDNGRLGIVAVRSVAFAMMTVLLCANLGTVLGACQMRDPYVAAPATATSGNWKIERQVDRITGVPVQNIPRRFFSERQADGCHPRFCGDGRLKYLAPWLPYARPG
jgi:hypothetical protein